MSGFDPSAVRWGTLLLMAASLIVSAERVVHAHADGAHEHRFGDPCEHDHSRLDPVACHAHVWLFGWECHIPIGEGDDLDPEYPAGLAPSWCDMPTVVDAGAVSIPTGDAAIEATALVSAGPFACFSCRSDIAPHSGLSPGRATRICLASLTL
jgi:hypothetical protein